MKIFKSQSNEIKDLSDCLKRAERFLSYVISIRDYFRTKNESELDYEWMQDNCMIIQEHMNKILPKQLGVAYSNGFGRKISRTQYNTVATFLANLQQPIPKDLKIATVNATEQNLRNYIQKMKEILKNPKKFKEMKEEKRQWYVVEFDKTKVTEILFGIGWVASLPLLLNKDLFIFGFIMNLVSGIIMLILSFIKVETK